ncbi:MAG: hypothetical protein WCJ30_08640 [Deltaproteobacteria bacterium]
MRSPSASDWFFFDVREQTLVSSALEALRTARPALEQTLLAHLDRLQRLATVIHETPSIMAGWVTHPRTDSPAETLIDVLCRVPDYDVELHIPTKAVVGQAYLVAKINFLKALGYALEHVDGAVELRERADFEIGQSIYSKMAEELFVSILTDARLARRVRVSAATFLFRMWDDRLQTEVDDLAPLLESAWQARNRVRPVLGTMMGTQEIFLLFKESRDERVLDYFVSGKVTDDEIAAFEEFVFGLSYEEIHKLRTYVVERGSGLVSGDQARELLGHRRNTWPPDVVGPQGIYANYKRRRVNAQYRLITSAPGPKKSAEEYVMIALLASESDVTKR